MFNVIAAYPMALNTCYGRGRPQYLNNTILVVELARVGNAAVALSFGGQHVHSRNIGPSRRRLSANIATLGRASDLPSRNGGRYDSKGSPPASPIKYTKSTLTPPASVARRRQRHRLQRRHPRTKIRKDDVGPLTPCRSSRLENRGKILSHPIPGRKVRQILPRRHIFEPRAK